MKPPIPCRVCGNSADLVFEQAIMNGKHTVGYYFCTNCELLQVEEPYWLDEAYASPINLTDTGIMLRNMNFASFVAVIIYGLFDKEAKYMDFAGGYGIFTRLMRDIGYDFYWQDIYTQNLVARGFEYKPEMGKVRLLTAFETFEHFVQPIQEIERMLELSDTIVFSTQLLPQPTPKPEEWWYYCFEHGQHTAFYRAKTMQTIASKFGLNFYTNGGDFHMLTKEKLIPGLINARQAQKLIAGFSAIQKELWDRSYAYNSPMQLLTKKPEQVARNIYQSVKYGSFYELKPDVDKSALSLLFTHDFLQEYFNFLLHNAGFLKQKFVQPHLAGKAHSDMLYMTQFMHKK